ncbi:MAG TPA: hypothetical protein VGG45_12615, partial [Terracidiphilus sp.]
MSISLLWQIVYYAWFASELAIAIVTRTGKSGGKRQDRGTMAILWVTIVGSITAGEWLAAVSARNMFGGAPWVITAALVIMVIGLAIRWTAVISLGKAFSANVAIRPSQTVYRSG